MRNPPLRVAESAEATWIVPVGQVALGILERGARGNLLLAHRLYPSTGKQAAKTSEREAVRERNKAILLDYIERNRADGSPLQDLLDLLPALSRDQVKSLLKQLRAEGKARVIGGSKNARW